MLTVIEGGFHTPYKSVLIDRIRAAIDSKKRVYLIVPEQQTVLAECRMSRELPSDAPLCFEVTNFTRFANSVFREVGGISGEYCSPVLKSLTMWRVLFELAGKLDCVRRESGVTDGAVKRALAAVSEMQAGGILAEDIARVLDEDITDRRLKSKLSDLGRIYSAYEGYIGEKYQDTASDMSALAELLTKRGDFLSNTEIFIDGFTSFTMPQYKVIEAMTASTDITVMLPLDALAESLFEYREVLDTKSRLLRCADRTSAVKKQEKLRDTRVGYHPVLSEVARLLWRSSGKIDNESLPYLDECGGRVRIFSALTAYEACEHVASDIRRRVIDGAKFSDFAIVVRDSSAYDGILDAALDGEGVPYFFSRGGDILNTAPMKLIASAYAAIIYGFGREDVINYLKSGLLGIREQDIDLFELYCEKWDIDRHKFLTDKPWSMNPDGYDSRSDNKELLDRINATRRALIEPLVSFRREAFEARTTREHATALLNFLTGLKLEDALLARCEELSALGEAEAADEYSRIWGIICDALDGVVEVLGDLELDPSQFLSQFKAASGGATIGKIPAFSDVVTVGVADMLRAEDKRHVYLIGVNEGEFPRTVSDSSYFAEQEKLELSRLGLPLECDVELRAARELFCFSRAFSIADETVTLLYAEKTAMLSPLTPGGVIGRISEITDGKVKPCRISEMPIEDRIYSPTSAERCLGALASYEREEVKSALTEAGYGDVVSISEGRISNSAVTLSGDVLALLYRRDLYLSQTRIDKFLGCPMSYFLEYTLKLNDREPAELGANVIGSFVHAVLENFFSAVKTSGRKIKDITKEERDRIAEDAARKYTSQLLGDAKADARLEIAISRLGRATRPVIDGICDELGGSEYEPTFFELETNPTDPTAPNHVVITGEGGERVIIRGTIDRVDTFKSGNDVYVRVVDYKTGHNEFLPSKLKDGEYLQMFLYLKAIADSDKEGFLEKVGVGEGGRIIPAGVIYVKTKVRDTVVRSYSDEEAEASIKEMQKRDGMVLLDPVSIDAMNPDFMPPKPGPQSRSFEAREYDMDGWREIEKTLSEVVLSVSRGMRCGSINATPATKGGRNCKWCKFKSVCRSAVIKNDF